jgi:phospholipase C
VLDAYTGKSVAQHLPSHQTFADELELGEVGGWHDLIVNVSGDASFRYQLAGHIEAGKDSILEAASGGLVRLKCPSLHLI